MACFDIGTEVINLSMYTSVWNPNLYFVSGILWQFFSMFVMSTSLNSPLIGQKNSAFYVILSCFLHLERLIHSSGIHSACYVL